MTTGARSPIHEINQDLLEVWKQYGRDVETQIDGIESNPDKAQPLRLRCPLQYPAIETDAIVFVGFNPSFSYDAWHRIRGTTGWKPRQAKQVEEANSAIEQLFASNPSAAALVEIKQLEAQARDAHDFFKFHKVIEKKLGLRSVHLDLFAFRHTSQGEASQLLFDDKKYRCSDFANAQLKVFNKLLEHANPRAVVITNALASRIYLRLRGIRKRFDVAEGCYRDDIGGRTEVPVLPAGMLTSAHAMDRYSRQRLLWQLGRIVARDKEWDPGTTPDKDDPYTFDDEHPQ